MQVERVVAVVLRRQVPFEVDARRNLGERAVCIHRLVHLDVEDLRQLLHFARKLSV
jgi:hypothetical protein